MNLNYPNISPAQLAKMRFKAAKEKCNLNLNGFRELVIAAEPSYNSVDGWDRIRTTWSGRCADLRLTEIITEVTNSNN